MDNKTMDKQKLKQHHSTAADHHQKAADQHRKAAEHHEAGNHEKANSHAHMATANMLEIMLLMLLNMLAVFILTTMLKDSNF